MLGIIPLSPTITIDRDAEGKPLRYCLDAKTESIMQNQRKVAMALSVGVLGSTLFMKAPKFVKIGVGTVAALSLLTQFAAYNAVQKAEAQSL
jgi:hypothetical protein